MAVFNDQNIQEKPLNTALQERNLPISNTELNSFINGFLAAQNLPGSEADLNSFIDGWRNDNLAEVTYTAFTGDPPVGVPEEPIFPTIGVKTTALSGGLPTDILEVHYYDGAWVKLWPAEAVLSPELQVLEADEAALARVEHVTAANHVALPTDQPTENRLVRVVGPLNSPQGESFSILQIFLFHRIPGTTNGSWAQVYDSRGVDVPGDPVEYPRVINSTTGTPNGLLTSRFRGDITIYGNVTNDVVSRDSDVRVFFALNGGTNNHWVEVTVNPSPTI